MADDIEETVVTGNNVTPRSKTLLSPWKAALLGAPGGPFVSLGFGLAQHFRNKSFLEEEARRNLRDKDERDQLEKLVAGEQDIADPDEKRILSYASGLIEKGYLRAAEGDKTGYDMIGHARELIEGIQGADAKQRKEEVAKTRDFQRTLVGDAAKGYRNEYQSTLDQHASINNTAQQVLSLVADPNFDPNKPANKAVLAELLSMSAIMFKDTPDLLDGVAQGVGAFNNTAGGIMGGVATMMKSEDFKMSPEDYNRLALNAQKYANIYAQQKFQQLGSQASNLEKWGKHVGVLDQDYSLQNYVSGGEEDLRFVPNPLFTGGYKPGPGQDLPTSSLVKGAVNIGEGIKRRMRLIRDNSHSLIPKRPTN